MITLYFIAHTRQKFLARICQEIYHIKQDLKDNLEVVVLNDQFCNSTIIGELEQNFQAHGIKFKNVISGSYLDKCIIMSQSTSEFIIKCDEDIFMTTHGWNAFLSDLNRVNWDKNALYAPVISTGIPTIELFLDTFVDPTTIKWLRSMMHGKDVGSHWGVDYSHIKYDEHKPYDFFLCVKNFIKHYYKGVHPIRFSLYMQKILVDYVLASDNWRAPKYDRNLVPLRVDAPYFCNSIFLMPTHSYKCAIDGILSGRYINDGFDEVGLNQMLGQNDNTPNIYNLNAVAIHPSYNSIGLEYNKISEVFFENI